MMVAPKAELEPISSPCSLSLHSATCLEFSASRVIWSVPSVHFSRQIFSSVSVDNSIGSNLTDRRVAKE